MVDKEIIKRNFSRCAPFYDKYSTVQNLCALELISQVETNVNNLNRILDIGCGTGNYTRLLRIKFPQAIVKAIDISPEMIKIAKRKLQNEAIELIVADGESIDLRERFDLISSNVSLQWFENLKLTLLKYRQLLNENGLIAFSIFGSDTFFQLNESLQELFKNDIQINSFNFFSQSKLEKILKSLFKKNSVQEKIYQERHNSLSEFLQKIKYTGARGSGLNKRKLWTPKTMDRLEKIYREKAKGIIVTYQVFFCRAMK
jgi:malonyl-CoA O-methyltransferase